MQARILTNKFDPAILQFGAGMTMQEITLQEVREELKRGYKSAIATQASANEVAKVVDMPIRSRRGHVALKPLDRMVCVIKENDNFRFFLGVVMSKRF